MQGNETILVQLIIWFSHIFPFFITLNCCHGNQLFSNTIRITDNIIPSFCTVVCFIIWLNFILIVLLSFYHIYILSTFYILYLSFSIYTLSDLGNSSNLICSLSRTIQQYSPPSEWIMCELAFFPFSWRKIF